MEQEQAHPGAGRRARQKAATRRAIYEAAMELFLARGYDAVTVEDVCRATDVAKGTFFLHFPTKDALLAEYGREATGDLHERLGRHRGSAVAALRLALRVLAERAGHHPEIVRLTVRETMARPAAMAESTNQGRDLGALITEIVRRGRAAGEFRKSVVPEVGGAVLVGAYFAIVNAWATTGEAFDLGDAVEQALKIVLHGLKE